MRPPTAPSLWSSKMSWLAPPATSARASASARAEQRDLAGAATHPHRHGARGRGQADLDVAGATGHLEARDAQRREVGGELPHAAAQRDVPRHGGREREVGGLGAPVERPEATALLHDDRVAVDGDLGHGADEAGLIEVGQGRVALEADLRGALGELKASGGGAAQGGGALRRPVLAAELERQRDLDAAVARRRARSPLCREGSDLGLVHAARAAQEVTDARELGCISTLEEPPGRELHLALDTRPDLARRDGGDHQHATPVLPGRRPGWHTRPARAGRGRW